MEKNPAKFFISVEELSLRQRFLQEVKLVLRHVKDQLREPNELLSSTRKKVDFDVAKNLKALSISSNGVGFNAPPNAPWVQFPYFSIGT